MSMSLLKLWTVIPLSSMVCGYMPISLLSGKVLPPVLILFLSTSSLK